MSIFDDIHNTKGTLGMLGEIDFWFLSVYHEDLIKQGLQKSTEQYVIPDDFGFTIKEVEQILERQIKIATFLCLPKSANNGLTKQYKIVTELTTDNDRSVLKMKLRDEINCTYFVVKFTFDSKLLAIS